MPPRAKKSVPDRTKPCDLPGCILPNWLDTYHHNKALHGELSDKTKRTGKVSCPCQNPLHARYAYESARNMARNCAQNKCTEQCFDPEPIRVLDPEQDEEFHRLYSPSSDARKPEAVDSANPPDNPDPAPDSLVPDDDPDDVLGYSDTPPPPDQQPTPRTDPPDEAIARARELVANYDYSVHETYNWVICRTCGKIVPLDNAAGHWRRNHKITGSKLSEDTLKTNLLLLHANDPLPPSRTPIERVPELQAFESWSCDVEGCADFVSYRSLDSFLRHHSTHDLEIKERKQRCHLQSCHLQISATRSETFYPITFIPIPSASLVDLIRAIDSRHPRPQPAKKFVMPKNPRMLGPIYERTGWAAILEPIKDLRDAMNLTELPAEGDMLFPLIGHMKSYVAHSLPMNKCVSRTILNELHTNETQVFGDFYLMDNTVDKYSKYFTRLLCFLMRVVLEHAEPIECPIYAIPPPVAIPPPITIPPPATIPPTEAVPPTDFIPPPDVTPPTDPIPPPPPTVVSVHPECTPPPAILPPADANPPPVTLPPPPVKIFIHPTSREKLKILYDALRNPGAHQDFDQIILECIWSLICCTPAQFSRNDAEEPITKFLAISNSRDEHGTLDQASSVSSKGAALIWVYRATGIRKILFTVHSDPLVNQHEVWQRDIASHMDTSAHNMYTRATQVQNLLHNIASTEEKLPNIIWDSQFKNISVDGNPISLADFKGSLHDGTENLLERIHTLGRGCDISHVVQVVEHRLDPSVPSKEWLIDQPRDKTSGVGFVDHNELDRIHGTPDLLFHHLVATFFHTDNDGNVYCNQNQAAQWFAELKQIVQRAFVLMYFTMGGGARGTELGFLLYRNHSTTLRHAMIFNAQLSIRTDFLKTTHLTSKPSTIIRTPAPKVQLALVIIILVLYPAAERLLPWLRKTEENAYGTHLFVVDGVPMSERALSDAIQEFTMFYFGSPMRIRVVRQLCKAIANEIANVQFEDEADEDRMRDKMFGHSSHTANTRYAVDHQSLSMLPVKAVAQFQRYSTSFHLALGLGHRNYVPKQQDAPPEIPDSTGAILDEKRLVAMVKECVSENHAPLLRDIRQQLRTDMIAVNNSFLQQISNLFSLSVDNPAPIHVHPRLIECLDMLSLPSDKERAFTMPEQAELIQMSFSADRHCIAVLPTGQGKTMAAFGPLHFLPDKCVIMVSPLNALTNDLERRLGNIRLTGGIWSPDCNLDAHRDQVILVSAHYAATDNFFNWVLTIKGRVLRIVIDEAHHIYTSDVYRNCFDLFVKLMRLGIPFTFISATILQLSVPTLCHAMGISQNTIVQIRARTTRTNIAYNVQEVREGEERNAVQAILDSILPLDDKSRALIFLTSVDGCKEMHKEWNLPCYYAAVPNEEKQQLETDFLNGETAKERIMVCTLCFGQGVDCPDVRYVIHVNPREGINFLQESGRAGRNGLPAKSFVIYSRLPTIPPKSVLDHTGNAALCGFMTAKSECRRLSFSPFEPQAKGHSCAALGAELCDNCVAEKQNLELGPQNVMQPISFSSLGSYDPNARLGRKQPRAQAPKPYNRPKPPHTTPEQHNIPDHLLQQQPATPLPDFRKAGRHPVQPRNHLLQQQPATPLPDFRNTGRHPVQPRNPLLQQQPATPLPDFRHRGRTLVPPRTLPPTPKVQHAAQPLPNPRTLQPIPNFRNVHSRTIPPTANLCTPNPLKRPIQTAPIAQIPIPNFAALCRHQTDNGSLRPAKRRHLPPLPDTIIPNTIEADAYHQDALYKQGTEKMQKLKDAYALLEQLPCARCWVDNSHICTHPSDAESDAWLEALKKIAYPSYRYWNFCYLCLTPFRSPFIHLPHPRDQPINPENCAQARRSARFQQFLACFLSRPACDKGWFYDWKSNVMGELGLPVWASREVVLAWLAGEDNPGAMYEDLPRVFELLTRLVRCRPDCD